jgi:hypothetical protein
MKEIKPYVVFWIAGTRSKNVYRSTTSYKPRVMSFGTKSQAEALQMKLSELFVSGGTYQQCTVSHITVNSKVFGV